MALQVATDHDDGGSTRHGGMSMDEKGGGNNRRGHVDRTIDPSIEGKRSSTRSILDRWNRKRNRKR